MVASFSLIVQKYRTMVTFKGKCLRQTYGKTNIKLKSQMTLRNMSQRALLLGLSGSTTTYCLKWTGIGVKRFVMQEMLLPLTYFGI
ncbi:MAG: hypothetical protein CMN72_00365 [Sphingomonas sp.]|nr:hypothetical protein [Sphingomonas sp.]